MEIWLDTGPRPGFTSRRFPATPQAPPEASPRRARWTLSLALRSGILAAMVFAFGAR